MVGNMVALIRFVNFQSITVLENHSGSVIKSKNEVIPSAS